MDDEKVLDKLTEGLRAPRCTNCAKVVWIGRERCWFCGVAYPIDALALCNACDAAPADDNRMGYCIDCIRDWVKVDK